MDWSADDPVDRPVEVRAGGSVPVELKEGADKVTFGNATAWASCIDRIEMGRVVGLL
ncbi:hypothetical protein ACFYVK_12015 [Streptomyces chartreusis]|uniref:hypothetical protein n=1 Tax=Streptomyces chartreusis TaxID=1969 RepID=UPI0036A76D70